MANKYCFEAVDRSLCDIMKGIKEDNGLKPFSRITTILGGDFRQILPVVRKGDRHDMIQACIKNSYLWKSCEVHLLRKNMRLQSNELESISKDAMQNFVDWILDVGDGKQCSDIGESWISIEQKLMLPKSHDGV
ncbi:ATP-dependent DNA helicase RRM3-like [Cicer arietinum]|uniref:ATP-dependent DNA helicase RRM3-like n=1 Tax=Cicer arietinum TaxID=3827 RepID=UPI003CC54D1C